MGSIYLYQGLQYVYESSPSIEEVLNIVIGQNELNCDLIPKWNVFQAIEISISIDHSNISFHICGVIGISGM